MAETYTTSIFNNAGKPPPTGGAAQTGAATTGVPGAAQTTGSEQYHTPVFQQQTGGGQTQQPPAGPGWGINWHGDVTMPQSVQDFDAVATNEALAYGLPGLRTQAAQARPRLGPDAAAAADFTGSVLSPTQLLNAVPVAGPELAGATHEGVKSYMQGNDKKTIMEDTALGGFTGLLGHGLASQAPKYFGDATRELVKGLPAGFLGLHAYGMGHDLGAAAGALGLYGGLSRLGGWAGKQVEDIGSWPSVQQAIKTLVLGGGSAARQQTGPLDQYIMPGP